MLLNRQTVILLPFTKKRQTKLKNYRPVSLLSIFGKFFERLLFNKMFKLFIENKPLSSNQSRFKLGNSCIKQLLSIAHDICDSFDVKLEIRRGFVDILKLFDKN